MNQEIVFSAGRSSTTDKIKRYGWSVRDEPGVLLMVPKGQLKVDPTYQRDFNEKRANKMASNWSWVACGALVVADRGGDFYVVVGQHRLGAAMKRSDVKELPCLIFQSEGIRQEASGFLAEAMDKKGIDWVDQLRAKKIAGDQVAVRMTSLCNDIGRSVSRGQGANTISCVAAIYKELASDFDRAEGIVRLMALICKGMPFEGKLFSALCYVEKHLEEGRSLKHGKLRERVVRLGPNVLLDEIARASAFYRKGGTKVWADAVVTVINRGLRSNKISLSNKEIEDGEEE